MGSAYKHKMGEKNSAPDDEFDAEIENFLGDPNNSIGEDAGDTNMIANILAEATKAGGGLIADKQTAAAKAAADAKAKAGSADATQAQADAAQAHKLAALATIDAHKAMMQADVVEPGNPSGPQHVAAQKLQANADLLTANAKAADEKAAYYASTTPGAPPPPGGIPGTHGGGMPGAKGSSMLTPTNIGIGLGVLVAGFVGYKLLTRKK